MKRVIITVEDEAQVEAILAVLEEAEWEGDIDFSFDVKTEGDDE